jgi:ADP-ribose pyrophosphatase YjhB (NUDIX family)
MMGIIRPIAICLFLDKQRILVSRGYDSVKKETFYRPLGGKIEFGETAIHAVEREIREEIDQSIQNIAYVGTLENIFTCNGIAGHEIVMVYAGDLADSKAYTLPVISGCEDDGTVIEAFWMELDDFRESKERLYPEGLLALVEQWKSVPKK